MLLVDRTCFRVDCRIAYLTQNLIRRYNDYRAKLGLYSNKRTRMHGRCYYRNLLVINAFDSHIRRRINVIYTHTHTLRCVSYYTVL